MGEHLYTYIDPPNLRHLDQIKDALERGGVIALGTGTSWAFAALSSSKKTRQRLLRLKPEHGADRPFALMCASISMATSMTVIDGSAYRLLKRIWPGPFTVLLQSNPALRKLMKTKRQIVGVRVPDDPFVQALLAHLDSPLMVTTVPALPSGQLPSLGFEVQEVFGHDLALVVDLGEPLPCSETTVIDLSEGEVHVLREGVGDVALL